MLNPIALLSIATLASAIPVAVWLSVFLRKQESKKTILLIFLLGCLTAPTLLGIQHLWDIFPNFNLANYIENSSANQNIKFALTFMLFGGMEELIKLYVVKAVDERTILIQKVNDAVRYSIVSALGFSFIENIYYLYQFWPQLSTGSLTGLYIFRSVFTTCAHIIFSGIFGYFYGIGKYSILMTHQARLSQKQNKIGNFIAKHFRLPLSEGYRQQIVLKGVLLAIGLHATFNFLLQINLTLPVILLIAFGYIYLKYLLSRKAGHLLLTNDITTKAKSTIVPKDEEVVLELLGMWFKERRYVDVIHVAQRLLDRDPDNRVVKLFKAQAIDAIDNKDPYKKILTSILPTQQQNQSTITKYLTEKEEFKKAQKQIKATLKKEGKTFIKQPKTQKTDPEEIKKQNLTGDGTFKIG